MITPYPRYRLQTTIRHYGRWLGGLPLNLGLDSDASKPTKLEETFQRTFGTPHAVSVPMARTGIYLCLKALLRPERREVILSPLTISDVVSVVICAGGIPVFCDVDPVTLALCPSRARELITPRTGALLVTHLYGMMADMPALSLLCQEAGLPLIEDCAQALGSSLEGRPAGTWGHAGIFSFGIYKNVVGLYGGMITTRDPKLNLALKGLLKPWPLRSRRSQVMRIAQASLRELALSPGIFDQLTYRILRFAELTGLESINRLAQNRPTPARYETLPRNYSQRMTSAQQATCSQQVEALDLATEARRLRGAAYHRGLAGLAGLHLPPERREARDAYLYYAIRTKRARALHRRLLLDRRDVATPSVRNCATLDAFSEFRADCPRAQEADEQTLLLPTYPGYPLDEVERNIASIQRFFTS